MDKKIEEIKTSLRQKHCPILGFTDEEARDHLFDQVVPQAVIKRNKLIFDFMGCVHSKEETIDKWEMELLKYHSSWDALMPVVEKIESLSVIGKEENIYTEEQQEVEWNFSVEIMNGGCVIHRDVSPQYHGTDEDFLKLYSCLKTDKIKSAWEAVVKFIQWHNEQTKSNNKSTQ